MANFPTNIRRAYTLTDLAPEDPAIRTSLENGMEQTRARYTRIRRSWKLAWNAIEEADFQTIFAHYCAQKGGSDYFLWTHPVTGDTYTVRYIELSESVTAGLKYRSGFSVSFREV